MEALIGLIAQLCVLHPASGTSFDTATAVDRKQLECQQYYIKCMKQESATPTTKNLLSCIEGRSIK